MSRKAKSRPQLIQLPDDDETEVNWNEYSNWKHWCRLCAKEDRSNIDVFRKKEGKGSNFTDGTLATAIGKYFWVNIKTDDGLPKHVCGECETLLNELCTFTERVNKVQTMFALLLNIQNDKLIDPNELRLQYGLLDEERQHIIRSPEQQETEYEVEQEVEMLVNEEDALEVLEDDYEEKASGKEQHYEHEEVDEDEQHEEEEEFAMLEDREEIKPEPFIDNLEEEKLDDDNDNDDDDDVDNHVEQDVDNNAEQDIELDADLMEQLSQELELNDGDCETIDSENADNPKSCTSQEQTDIEDEDETLLSQVREEIKALKKFHKKEKPTNKRLRKRGFDWRKEMPRQQQQHPEQQPSTELKKEQQDDQDGEEEERQYETGIVSLLHQDYEQDQEQESKHDITENQEDDAPQVNKRIVIDPRNGQKLEIIIPPKRRRGRPARDSEEYLRNKRLKAKQEYSDGNLSEEASLVEFRFECALCPKKYKSCVIYKRHMNEVHNIIDDTVVEYSCEKCSKTFQSERNLSLHIRSHLPLEEKLVHHCPYCEKRFTKEAILVQHINGSHLNEKPFICEECGRGLKTHAALREHKLTHTDDCPFECEVCHKRFKNKARLKIHSDIHAETIYKCEICNEILNTRRTLNMHMLVHSDVKAFKCDYCGNAFKRAKALKNHLLIHTGLKPYICNFCYKPFSNGSNCRSHKKKAHPEELAAMEAAGEKVKPANVPKLDHLRAVSKAAENMQPVSKPTTLPSNWRQILLKAEARATRLDEKYKQEAVDSEDSKSQSQLEESNDVEVELAAMEC